MSIILRTLGGLGCGYTFYIQSSHWFKNPKNDSSSQGFSRGSADELIMDQLSTGDIILFSRRWYHYHIPIALCISFYHNVLGCEFDHAGIVVQHPISGIPYIIEKNPFSNISCRRFDTRIQHSKSHQILLIKLLNSDDIKVPIHHNIKDIKESQYLLDEFADVSKNSSELWGFIGIFSGNKFLCPNADLVFKFFNSFGIMIRSNKSLDLKTILNRDFVIENSKKSSTLKFHETNIIIRTV